jgi:hypothetical protein
MRPGSALLILSSARFSSVAVGVKEAYVNKLKSDLAFGNALG